MGNSVTVFSRRQKRPTSKAQLHSHLGIAVRQKKAKSKLHLQAACRGETGLGKGKERKGDSDTGITSPPLRAISATVMLQNACLLHFLCPPNHTDPCRGQPGHLLSKIRYSPAEIWRLCTRPQQSRITAWGKKMQNPHPHGHPNLSGHLGGRIQSVVGAHPSCPAPDGRGWGHAGAAADLCTHLCRDILSPFPILIVSCWDFSHPALQCTSAPSFPDFSCTHQQRPLAAPACAWTAAAQGNDSLPNAALLSTVAGRIANPAQCLWPYNPQR